MKTIGIDCRFAGTHSGLGRYTRELVTHLLRRRDPFHYVLFVRSADEPWLSTPVDAAFSLVPSPIAHYSLAEQTKLPSLLRKSSCDLFFSPHFNVPFFCPVPFVFTVHDLILHRFPNAASASKQAAYRILLRRACAKAERIIAVSEFSARELKSAYGRTASGKVRVVHEAVSPSFAPASLEQRQAVRERYGLQKPYFLYVGNAKEHKNVPLLLRSFAALGSQDMDLILVTGGPEASRLPPLPPGARLLPDLHDEDLPALYSEATCFVSASLYEGFGLPLLEAHACGCPSIVTNRASFPEIAPPGTALVEPTETAFAAALRSPPSWQPAETMRTWEEVAAETAEVLREASK